MAADVSSLVRLMNGGGGDANESASAGKSSAAPITMDLLAGCCTLDSKELDLDLQVPCGWEKRLDLKSGKIYLQRCNSSNSSSSTSEPNKPQQSTKSMSKFQDLNFPKQMTTTTLNLFNDANLDLKLVSLSSRNNNYESVCTLDKVKSALERAEKETSIVRKRPISMSKSSSIRSNSSSSIKVDNDDVDQEEKSISALFAARCPSCLMCVLISKGNPKCPRCNGDVPLPLTAKKPRIDLNISI